MKLDFRSHAVVLCCVLLATGISYAGEAQEDGKAIDDYNFAAWLYNAQVCHAADSYQEFLKHHADHRRRPMRVSAGSIPFHLDRFKEAAEQYEAVRSKSTDFPQMPELLFQLGQTRVALSQFADGQKLFADLRARFPDHYLADWAMAREAACLISMGKAKEAESLLQTFLAKYTAPDKPTQKVPATTEMLGKLDKAGVNAGDTFLSLVERSVFYQALAQFNQDRFDDARKSFEKFLAQYPQSKLQDEARFRLAQSLFRQNASRKPPRV